MLQYRLYGGNSLPAGLHGLANAGANIGSVIGQFTFGYLADSLGRKAIYGKELMLIIFATIMCITVPTGSLSPNSCLIYLAVFRIILGIGVGGDYPMSASVTTDRSNLRKRGTMLAYIFANQGWGSFVGALVTIIVLACYKHVMNDEGETSKVDGVWRIVIGVSLIPAFGTLYQRITMPESKRYMEAKQMTDRNSETDLEKEIRVIKEADQHSEGISGSSSDIEEKKRAGANAHPGHDDSPEALATKKDKAQFREFLAYFSEWRHAKILIGTCSCWFFLDIAYVFERVKSCSVLKYLFLASTELTSTRMLF